MCFQKDVFDIIDDKVTVHSENKKILTCETNTAWLNICFGEDIYNKVKENDILNSGTYFGTRTAVVDLLDKMCSNITSVLNRAGNYLIIDQPAMNIVVYDDPGHFNIRTDNMVYNLAHSAKANFDMTGELVSVNETTPYVLHQYDIIPDLRQYLYSKYKT